jgi:hypothetical protein
MYEYIKNNPETWVFQKLPDIPQGFQEELTRFAGVNKFGQPNLRVVKGNEVLSDKASDRKRLKYHAGYTPVEVAGYRYEENGVKKFTTELETLDPSIFVVPCMEQEQLGMMRYIIEKWTSPEDLERQNRFQKRYAQGDLTPTMREFPREGIYDCYFILERPDGTFRKLDKDVLDFVKMKWHYDQKPFHEREADLAAAEDKEYEEAEKQRENLWDAAVNFDLKLPIEERERREHYWATQHDYEAERQRLAQTSTFYI